MGALPKRKISKARKGNRRSHNALQVPAIVPCPKCGKAKRPHFKCDYCGFYGEVKKVSTKATKTVASKKVETAEAVEAK
jgi:large subunit ribosomal protein L32